MEIKTEQQTTTKKEWITPTFKEIELEGGATIIGMEDAMYRIS